MGEMLTRRELAEKYGLSVQRIHGFVHEKGLKEVPGSDGKNRIDEDEFLTHRAAASPGHLEAGTPETGSAATAQAGNIATARAAGLAARARLDQLKLQERSGQVVQVSVVHQQAFDVGQIFSQQLDQLVSRLSPVVAPLVTVGECREVLSKEVDRIKREVGQALDALIK